METSKYAIIAGPMRSRAYDVFAFSETRVYIFDFLSNFFLNNNLLLSVEIF